MMLLKPWLRAVSFSPVSRDEVTRIRGGVALPSLLMIS